MRHHKEERRLLISWADCRDDKEREQYIANAQSCGYPRNAKGEHGHWQHGSCFAPRQRESFSLPHTSRWTHGDSHFSVVELEDGTWLSDIFCYAEEPRYSSHEEALRAAVDRVVERATLAATEWGHYTVAQANAIIEYAYSVLNQPPPPPIPDPPKPVRNGQQELFA